MTMQPPLSKQYLFVSDFDQTLSFNDSGLVLGEILGLPDLRERLAGLSEIRLVQQGGELAYLLLHDPDLRQVRKEHLREAGKRVRLKKDIALLSDSLKDLGGHHFDFYVVSAAPEEVIQSALEGIVPADHIYATKFRYDDAGEIQSIARVGAGYGKVAVVEELRAKLMISHDRIVYVGDGSSDIHVMLHLNRMDGLTIAVSENEYITQIARRTVLSEDALSVLVPVLEEVLLWDSTRIRYVKGTRAQRTRQVRLSPPSSSFAGCRTRRPVRFCEANGLVLREWTKARTDTITLSVSRPEVRPIQ